MKADSIARFSLNGYFSTGLLSTKTGLVSLT